MNRLFAALVTLVVAACSAPKPTVYFPPGTFVPSDSAGDAFMRDWFSKHLAAMDEPSLSDHKGSATRFLYLRSFHHPLAVRVEAGRSGATLYAVEIGGAGGYEPGALIRRNTRTLSSSEWSGILDEIKALDFWRLPSSVPTRAFDGARWSLEVAHEGRYHVVQRHSPDGSADRAFRELCLRLLGHAESTPPENDLY